MQQPTHPEREEKRGNQYSRKGQEAKGRYGVQNGREGEADDGREDPVHLQYADDGVGSAVSFYTY